MSGNLHGAGGVGGLLAMKTGGENYFYAYDGNGNVRALVKADAANPAASGVVEKYAYDGFGREIPSSVVSGLSSGLNPFRFSTKQLDAETGMNYYGYRFYAADAGRWINRDPIAERGGNNIYAFIGNRTIATSDFLGLLEAPTKRVDLPYGDFKDLIAQILQRQLSSLEKEQLRRGCIGQCSILQANATGGEMQEKPEMAPSTKCFKTEQEASNAKCPNGKQSFVFSK